MLNRLVPLRRAGTTIRTEMVAWASTFATLSDDICSQSAILGVAGMDFEAARMATCRTSRKLPSLSCCGSRGSAWSSTSTFSWRSKYGGASVAEPGSTR